MVFSSLFFLYAFFPLCMLCYSFCRSLKAKNVCLLFFSLVFYTWGEPKYVLLLLLMSLCDWWFAKNIQYAKSSGKIGSKKWLILACVVNISLIVVFKYSKMICATIGFIPSVVSRITLPLGISFYTFQLLSYVIDVYRGDAEAQNEYWHILLYAALFHQCIAGPIVRYKTIANELFISRDERSEISEGCFRFSIGLAKKVVLANALGKFVDSLLLSDSKLADSALTAANIEYLSSITVIGAWVGVIAAALQLFLDFSAYSDMAIGMGKMIGLHYPENFNYPYISKTAGEYWRRWHITLGSWFRDYVYIPLGGNRCSYPRHMFNFLVVWLLTGLWHGASWSFVVWGLFWCFFMVLEQSFLKRVLDRLPGLFSHIYLIIIAIFAEAIFRFGNIKYTVAVYESMFGSNNNAFSDFTTETLIKNNLFLLLFGIIAATPLIKITLNVLKKRLEKTLTGERVAGIIEDYVIPAFLLLISTASLVGASYNPFLYFRF